MPPKVRFSKEAIMDAAMRLARAGGMEAVNARAIAHELGCSTQPLYRELSSMDDLRRGVLKNAMALFAKAISENTDPALPPYKASGMALLRFAHEEQHLYRMLFLRDRSAEAGPLEEPDLGDTTNAVYQGIMQATGYPLEKARRFHGHMFVYIQGMAAMIATGYAPYDEAFNSALLTEEYKALRLLFDTIS